MKRQGIIQMERLTLRPFKLSDSKRVQELARNPKISNTAINVPYPYENGIAEEWINTHKEDFDNDKSIIFAIVKKETKELIGSISLEIDRGNLKAELGYWIGVPYWGKGYGTESAKAIIKLGFECLYLNKIHGKVFDSNKASCAILEKVGMKYEGTLREEIIYGGRAIDLRRYAILKKDFTKNKKTI